ncbi:hypothetical protein [Nostoc sp. 106C]|uniref:hypothetical protein n=1 Tax=Nostoc sp. 106C TaxID=1932667 RepID=UPI000A3BF0A5|nr:hypothetical protein [Nostoc sp. 106C]OUL34670.1 hypothetical protein BV375_03500 [Nostoc sp. 106C]
MSIPKRGTRKIVVDGEPFIWLIRRQATNSQADYCCGYIHVAVEHAQEPGSVLAIRTDKPHSENWITEVKPVKPKDVARWILQAMESGWQPKTLGAPFIVQVVGECIAKV